MEERKLNFNHNDDPTLVEFTDDQKKEYEKSYKDFVFPFMELKKRLDEGNLDIGFKNTLCSLLEIRLITFNKSLGYEGYLQEQKEKRFKEIRDLNTENRELRKQLGDKVTPEDIREGLKNLSNNFKAWWSKEGFGHCSDEVFTGYTFKARLSGMMTDAYWSKDDNYETAEEKAKRLSSIGFDIILGAGRVSKVLFTENNVNKLSEMLKSKYPSSSINEVKSYWGRREECELRDIEIYITDLNDLAIAP